MSRRGRTPRDFLDYDSVSDAELERLARDGLVDISPPFDSSVLFDPQFERRADELTRKPFAGVQSVSVLEQKQGPWSGNPQLGIEQPFAPATNNEQTILKLDEWGMPRRWQVTLGMTFTDVISQSFDVVAVVNFGAGGATQKIEVNWENGVSFPLTFNALNLIARYGENANIPDDLSLRVTLGLVGGGSNTNIARSISGLSADGGGAADFLRVPSFARSFRVYSNSPTTPNNVYDPLVIYNFSRQISGLGTFARIDGARAAAENGVGITIPPGTRFLIVANGTANPISGRIIWDLSS